jgi:two-component system chemotaxis response regulator CheB
VVVGSLGALDSFKALLGSLPPNFPAAIVFDLHRVNGDGMIEGLLRRRGALPVTLAEPGDLLAPGHIYVAPHDRQLLIDPECRFDFGEGAEGPGHPFADSLLASAARAFGSRLIAVVLSGRLQGGSRGVREVKHHGGRVLVEDPRVASQASMPNAALASGCVDFALSSERIAHALLALCSSTGAAELFRVRMNAAVAS